MDKKTFVLVSTPTAFWLRFPNHSSELNTWFYYEIVTPREKSYGCRERLEESKERSYNQRRSRKHCVVQ